MSNDQGSSNSQSLLSLEFFLNELLAARVRGVGKVGFADFRRFGTGGLGLRRGALFEADGSAGKFQQDGAGFQTGDDALFARIVGRLVGNGPKPALQAKVPMTAGANDGCGLGV